MKKIFTKIRAIIVISIFAIIIPVQIKTNGVYAQEIKVENDSEIETAITIKQEQALLEASSQAYAFEVLNLINYERTSRGLSPLTMDKKLYEAAIIRSIEISQPNNFSHTRPNSTHWYTIYADLNIPMGYAGENIAAGQRSPAAVVNSWMNSSGHRRNILFPDHTTIGIGCNITDTGYIYWVQLFNSKLTEPMTNPGQPQQQPTTPSIDNGTKTPDIPTISPGDFTLRYSTHVQNFGWLLSAKAGQTSGSEGLSLRLESIKISLENISSTVLGVEYSTHVQDKGWLNWTENGSENGTTGIGKRLEAIKIKLKGSTASNYDIYYRVHAQNFGWLGWAKNGEPSGTAGYSYRLESIQILLLPKNSPLANNFSTNNAFISK